MLEAGQKATTDEWRSRKARVSALALHFNKMEEDGYLKALLIIRPDLAGVSFTMGDACRTTGERAAEFKKAAEAVRSRKGAALLAESDALDAGEEDHEQFYRARLAVAAQVMPAEQTTEQLSLLRGLSSIPRPEATRQLARLAVFSPEKAVRQAAIEALAVRREGDATEVLVAGLSYPWPAVAENAATAIARLNRKDLVPQLERVLAAADPRSPKPEKVAGHEKFVAHELVRVNHLRNCLLCHAPAERDKTPDQTLIAEVPVPSMPLPDTSRGYGQSESNLLVRIDVTYLRQDFSAMQTVTDWTADAWSASQRFDFFVRKRVLTPEEVADLRERLPEVSPYQRAAAQARRLLTGRDFEVKPAQEGSRE
jgi:hypothetical protein